jgi:hypothetical protein
VKLVFGDFPVRILGRLTWKCNGRPDKKKTSGVYNLVWATMLDGQSSPCAERNPIPKTISKRFIAWGSSSYRPAWPTLRWNTHGPSVRARDFVKTIQIGETRGRHARWISTTHYEITSGEGPDAHREKKKTSQTGQKATNEGNDSLVAVAV